MGPVSLHCTEILLCLKISIRLGSDSVWCASLILHRKYKVHKVGFVTVETGLLHLHYDSKDKCKQTCTYRHRLEELPLQMPKPFQVTTLVHLILLQCSVSSVAIEFVPLSRVWNFNSTGLCLSSVTCMTATITLWANQFQTIGTSGNYILRVTVKFHALLLFNSHLGISLSSHPVCYFLPLKSSKIFNFLWRT